MQIIVLVVLGAVFFLAALLVNHVPVIFDAGLSSAVFLGGSIPGAWVFVKLVLWVVRRSGQHALLSVSITTIAALFLDGWR